MRAINYTIFTLISAIGLFMTCTGGFAQSVVVGGDGPRTITTAVPFLTIAPDARSAAMGDAGAASTPDNNSQYWNPGKLGFKKEQYGAAINYTPWLTNLGVNDIYLTYLSAYTKLRREDALAVDLRYFSMGNIQFTDENGNEVQQFQPNEFAIGATYSRALSRNFGVGITGRFIHSNLTGNYSNDNSFATSPASTAAVDVAAYYQKDILVGGSLGQIAFGGSISNFGPKVSYSNDNQDDFIPTNLRLGTRFTYEVDPYNKFSFLFDINKLMAPSPIVVEEGNPDSLNLEQNYGFMRGVFGSFNDAEGGFSEEVNELMYSAGVEYWYNDLFAIRAGYFQEHESKGNRKYFTTGFGIRYQMLDLAMSYLIATRPDNPLRNTLRFTLGFNFGETYSANKGDSVTE